MRRLIACSALKNRPRSIRRGGRPWPRPALQALEPSWRSTDLGRALLDALAELEDAAERGKQESGDPGRIVLVSDLQQGSRLESLGEREWPRDVELDVKSIDQSGSNAGLHPLLEGRDAEPGAPDQPVGVRVSNDSSSHREAFELLWLDSQGGEAGKPIPVYVPPGESRVARVPRPKGLSEYRGLRLKGDTDAFDNTLYLAAEPRREATVLFVGADGPDDPAGMLYFLNRIFPETPGRIVRVRSVAPASDLVFEPGESVPLVVLAAETKADNIERLRKFMDGGGTVLHVLTAPRSAATLAALTGASAAAADLAEAAPNRGALLTDIAFDHRLFAPLAAPQYSDFTKIRFWKYRRLNSSLLGEARTLARFDTGDPAVIEKSFGKGRLVVLRQRLGAGRQPDRPVVEILPTDGGPDREPRCRPDERAQPAGRRPRALAPARSRRCQETGRGQARRFDRRACGRQHVVRRDRPARHLQGAGRHGWKALVCLRRQRRPAGEQDLTALAGDPGAVWLPAGEPESR